jgi:hypothetical protein
MMEQTSAAAAYSPQLQWALAALGDALASTSAAKSPDDREDAIDATLAALADMKRVHRDAYAFARVRFLSSLDSRRSAMLTCDRLSLGGRDRK